jgi:pyrophosphatase PpaX
MIKAIIFDVDGVLVDSLEANLKFFSSMMTNFGYMPPRREEYTALFHRPMKEVIETLTKQADEKVIEKILLAGRRKDVPYPVELLSTPKDLEKIIKVLHENYTLGIVTSRFGENIYSMPQLANLKQYFQFVVGYEDTERHKPYPEPLLLIAQRLGVKSKECVYIGDAESDVLAARTAGMKVIIYSKNSKENFRQADACTSSFNKLPELILSLIEVD